MNPHHEDPYRRLADALDAANAALADLIAERREWVALRRARVLDEILEDAVVDLSDATCLAPDRWTPTLDEILEDAAVELSDAVCLDGSRPFAPEVRTPAPDLSDDELDTVYRFESAPDAFVPAFVVEEYHTRRRVDS